MMNTESRRAKRQVHDYMFQRGEQSRITESYVATPPALFIIDETGAHWALGYQYQNLPDAPAGEYAFNVLRNGVDTGEFASRIERRFGKMRIFTRNGYKVWTGRSFF